MCVYKDVGSATSGLKRRRAMRTVSHWLEGLTVETLWFDVMLPKGSSYTGPASRVGDKLVLVLNSPQG